MKKNLFLIILYLGVFPAFAHTLQKAKLWTAIDMQGPLSEDKKFQYYLEPQLRFISNSEPFNQGVVHVGLGYKTIPTLTLWFGGTWSTTHNTSGDTEQYRIWEQISWKGFESKQLEFATRTRFEQRRQEDSESWSMRLRQRFRFTFPLRYSHDLVLYDELFFNCNNPSWVDKELLDQNRAFIGLSFPITKVIRLETGYLNQYEWRSPDQMAHVLSCVLRIHNV